VLHPILEFIVVANHASMKVGTTEECWRCSVAGRWSWKRLGRSRARPLVEDALTLPVQVKGKKHAEVILSRNAADAEIAVVLAVDALKRVLDGKAPKKVIVVPQRIVNVVA
jgi:leucyl-tRNA synthetase